MNLKYLIREYKWATTPILYILLIVVASLVYTNKNSNHEITNGIIALKGGNIDDELNSCLLYTSPSPRDKRQSRMPSSA